MPSQYPISAASGSVGGEDSASESGDSHSRGASRATRSFRASDAGSATHPLATASMESSPSSAACLMAASAGRDNAQLERLDEMLGVRRLPEAARVQRLPRASKGSDTSSNKIF